MAYTYVICGGTNTKEFPPSREETFLSAFYTSSFFVKQTIAIERVRDSVSIVYRLLSRNALFKRLFLAGTVHNTGI